MDALAALRLQIAWGADEALDDLPLDRTREAVAVRRPQVARVADPGVAAAPAVPAQVVAADGPQDAPEERWEDVDRDDLLSIYEELERIGDPPRQILLLAYVHDKTQKEIAELLDLPLGTVKTHTTRTLARLRTLLGGTR